VNIARKTSKIITAITNIVIAKLAIPSTAPALRVQANMAATVAARNRVEFSFLTFSYHFWRETYLAGYVRRDSRAG